jgi:hypothetical protein
VRILSRCIVVVVLASSKLGLSQTPGGLITAAPEPHAENYGFWVTYGTMGALLFAILIAIVRGLKGWSLNDALSEDTGNGVFKASISRLIALLGFAVIICIYLGTGCGVIYRILGGGGVQDLSGLGTFLAGSAALFAPYLANQIKSAVIGVANGPTGSTPGGLPSVSSLSPNTISGGAAEKLTVTGSNLDQAQSAICTFQDGSESPIPAANVNILNAGAVELTVTMPAPKIVGSPYQSTFTLLTSGGQRISAGVCTIS